MPHHPRRSGLLYAHLATLLFGGAGLFGKWITASPLVIVSGRTLFASLSLVMVWALIQKSPLKLTARQWGLWGVSGALLAFHWVAFFEGIQRTNVAVGLLAFSTFPLFVAILEPMVDRQGVSKQSLVLSLMILIGVSLIGWDSLALFGELNGLGWGIASGASFAVLALINRRLIRQLSGIQVAAGQNTVAAFLLVPFAWEEMRLLSGDNWALLILLGVVFTGLAHTLFIQSLQTQKAQLVSLIVALEPVYGIIWSMWIWGDIPLPLTLLGGGLVLGAGGWPSWRAYREDKGG